MSEYIVNMSGNWSGKLTEIVRCRDCRYTGGEVDRGYFKGSCFCSMCDRYVTADGFCAWGERKTINKTVDFVTHDSGEREGMSRPLDALKFSKKSLK